jgi:hypothetical protein
MDHVNGQLEDVIVHFRVHFLDRALARAGPCPPGRCDEQAACPDMSRVCPAPLPRTQAQQDVACSASHCRTCLPLASRCSTRMQASPRNLETGAEREGHGARRARGLRTHHRLDAPVLPGMRAPRRRLPSRVSRAPGQAPRDPARRTAGRASTSGVASRDDGNGFTYAWATWSHAE